jgi:hypothetical protein
MLMMFSLPTDFAQTFIDFFTIFLVTIPSKFITELLDGGVFYSVWTTLFGDSDFIQLLLILALIIGVYVMLINPPKRRALL